MWLVAFAASNISMNIFARIDMDFPLSQAYPLLRKLLRSWPDALRSFGKRIVRHLQIDSASLIRCLDGQFWDFTADLAKGDTAYTNLALGAHTDNTYFSDPCGLQLFHLLSHTNGSGGATLLVDGFQAAAALRRIDSESYYLLARIQTAAHAAGDPDTLFRAIAPLLSFDPDTGELIRVRYNNDDRSALRSIDPEFVAPWYLRNLRFYGSSR